MISADTLREARKSYSVILQGMLRQYSKSASTVFFLCEGKDADYYRPRIGAIFADYSGPIEYRNCAGKQNLKDLRRAIAGNFSLCTAQILYFFDRDYEQDFAEINVGNAFVTHGYSVENYYTSLTAFKNIVSGVLFADSVHTPEDEELRVQIVAKFQRLQHIIHTQILLFNCWAWAQRNMIRTGKIDLNSFSLVDQIEIDIGQETASATYNLDSLNELAPERRPVTLGEISIGAAWFMTRSLAMSFRGKQEIDFLHLYIEILTNARTKGEAPFTQKRKISKRVSKKEIIADLSIFADTPVHLVKFLNYHKIQWSEKPSI